MFNRTQHDGDYLRSVLNKNSHNSDYHKKVKCAQVHCWSMTSIQTCQKLKFAVVKG
jgi:hypothetical protein